MYYYFFSQSVSEKLTISGKTGKQEGRLLIYFPKIEAKERSTGLAPIESGLAVASSIRQQILDKTRQILPATSAALFNGILLGAKESFPPSFYEALRNTGTLHVVAASGMNVSMVASFLVGVFGRIMRRQLAAMVVIAGILFYTALAMFEPSIVRASIMGGLVFTASLFNRQAAAALGLLLAAYFMLFFDPSLLFDIGFQLSFAATAGLLFIKPLLEGRLNKLGWVGEDFKTTVVAQAATLPILLANFGTVSLVSVLVNTLVLWTVPIVMTIGIAGALISFLPFISYFVFLSTLPFLLLFEKVVLLFNQPQFLVKIEMPVISIAGYYFLLIAFYLWLRNLWLRNRQLPAEQKSER
ncbi:ComEC/Rec2 family competence protein [Candidatus Microgenomates bacterium]|nr:ComEC/Rec2 family competence protein [Candidatus Microgenomates bacterium]